MDDILSKENFVSSPMGLGEGLEEVSFPIPALVRVAVPLTPEEREALTRVLSHFAGGAVELNIEITPEVIGGVWVRVGDKVIDGTLRRRLEMLRQHLIAQCRALVADHAQESQNTEEGSG